MLLLEGILAKGHKMKQIMYWCYDPDGPSAVLGYLISV